MCVCVSFFGVEPLVRWLKGTPTGKITMYFFRMPVFLRVFLFKENQQDSFGPQLKFRGWYSMKPAICREDAYNMAAVAEQKSLQIGP